MIELVGRLQRWRSVGAFNLSDAVALRSFAFPFQLLAALRLRLGNSRLAMISAPLGCGIWPDAGALLARRLTRSPRPVQAQTCADRATFLSTLSCFSPARTTRLSLSRSLAAGQEEIFYSIQNFSPAQRVAANADRLPLEISSSSPSQSSAAADSALTIRLSAFATPITCD